MAWLALTVGRFVVPDHDLGKLVDGNRVSSDGNKPLYLGIFRALYHGLDLRCGEPAGGFNCEFHAGCAF